MSPYVLEEIQHHCSALGIPVISPPKPDFAAASGCLQFGFQDAVSASGGQQGRVPG
jgi:hypothetical protein